MQNDVRLTRNYELGTPPEFGLSDFDVPSIMSV